MNTKKSPAKKVSLPRTNKQIIYPRCHLDSQHTLRRLAGYQHTPGNSRIPTRYRILRKIRFPVPSVVHLTSCFLPDSQHRGFSVKALLPLSPPQRFTIFSCWERILHGSRRAVKQKNLTNNNHPCSPLAFLSFKSSQAYILNGIRCSVSRTLIPETILLPASMNL